MSDSITVLAAIVVASTDLVSSGNRNNNGQEEIKKKDGWIMSIYFGSHTIIPIVVFGSNKREGE